jgi:hypothetical protein
MLPRLGYLGELLSTRYDSKYDPPSLVVNDAYLVNARE